MYPHKKLLKKKLWKKKKENKSTNKGNQEKENKKYKTEKGGKKAILLTHPILVKDFLQMVNLFLHEKLV